MGESTAGLKVKAPQKMYSEAFKRKVVREFETGLISKDGLKAKYQLGGKSIVLTWCRKYGRLTYSEPLLRGRRMKDPQQQRIKQLEAYLI
ncbi:MAG: hypothetical protein KDD94_01600 [Calditrichaeota bacterium]|nr:hypothetical protein [Calditrichota bacterium]